jgi:hypothetical protein
MKKKYNGRYRTIRAGDLVSGADKLLKKIGFQGLPELHLIDTSGKNNPFVDPEQTLRNA